MQSQMREKKDAVFFVYFPPLCLAWQPRTPRTSLIRIIALSLSSCLCVCVCVPKINIQSFLIRKILLIHSNKMYKKCGICVCVYFPLLHTTLNFN